MKMFTDHSTALLLTIKVQQKVSVENHHRFQGRIGTYFL